MREKYLRVQYVGGYRLTWPIEVGEYRLACYHRTDPARLIIANQYGEDFDVPAAAFKIIEDYRPERK